MEEKQRAEQAARDAEEKLRAEQAAREAEEKLRAKQAAREAEEKQRAEQAARDAEEKQRAEQAIREAEEKQRADQAAREAEEKRKAEAAHPVEEQRRTVTRNSISLLSFVLFVIIITYTLIWFYLPAAYVWALLVFQACVAFEALRELITELTVPAKGTTVELTKVKGIFDTPILLPKKRAIIILGAYFIAMVTGLIIRSLLLFQHP